MFDINNYKRSVKEWMAQNPEAEIVILQDYCENLIPANEYTANKWLIDQTLSWYKHILESRESRSSFEVQRAS